MLPKPKGGLSLNRLDGRHPHSRQILAALSSQRAVPRRFRHIGQRGTERAEELEKMRKCEATMSLAPPLETSVIAQEPHVRLLEAAID